MCGRFNLRTSEAEFDRLFGTAPPATGLDLLERYNIAPTQPIIAVRDSDAGREGAVLQWGLIPSWSKDPKGGARMINARSETAAEKPSFRAAFKRRRCLIPASGFYEWKQGASPKQPFHIFPHGGGLMAFAGLWERWSPPGGAAIESATILTTAANGTLTALHDRMPVILTPAEYEVWLSPDTPRERLQALLRPAPEDLLEVRAVSTRVNSPRNTGPDCIEPVEA